MTYKILISAPYMLPVVEKYRSMMDERGCEIITAETEERLDAEQLLPLMGDVDAVICGDDQFNADVLAASPRLKVLSKWGTGIDSIDQAAAAARGIAIRNVPNAFSEPVADTVLGWLLSFARRLPEQTENLRRGGWKKLSGHALNEATLGVIGVGNCGKAVIRRARAFGMRLLGNDIVEIDPGFIEQYGLEMVTLEALLRQADYVSLNCDLNTTSRHIIRAETIGLMPAHAVLFNAARGPLVCESDLLAALREGRLKGAALDVFENEPLEPDSPLRCMDNVMLSAHNANSSPMAWDRVHRQAIVNMLNVLENGE